MIEIVSIETPTLGDRSYLVGDGEVAFAVDPQRDIDRVMELADRRGERITHVFETHVHNDYVTGGLALARAAGAEYHVHARDEVAFARVPVEDGDEVAVGAMRVRAVATPGHTFDHLAYVLEASGRPPAVFTGGSLLYGATGRPDLLGAEHTDELAKLQHASANRLAVELPDETEIFPTHGFGSFCSSAQTEASSSTLGREKHNNPVLTLGAHDFVESLLSGLGDHPAYYGRVRTLNEAGPDAPDLSAPHRADVAEVRRRIEAGEWVIDLRTRTAFAAGHAPGSLSFGLDGSLAVHLGWLVPPGTPVTLLGATEGEVAQAQRELVRIGIDRPAAAATGGPERWTDGPPRTLPVGTFADLADVRHGRDVVVLDVRRDEEWGDSHLPGAVHIPLHELRARIGEVPAGEIWVHCASGYRSAIAASFLAAAGRQVVLIDDRYDAGESR
ncbi:MBL fold metallo-hydrolase [Spirillospora albida]|uniref:MBL fold metallo-hydrolase n=1 Tax=Spirillospora albida TaxID=58123 RepID=UPI0004C28379|nr:MBL fold metallo-hydrolase [Spirillospora albida]